MCVTLTVESAEQMGRRYVVPGVSRHVTTRHRGARECMRGSVEVGKWEEWSSAVPGCVEGCSHAPGEELDLYRLARAGGAEKRPEEW